MLQGVYANIVIVCLYCLYVCMFVCLFVCHWEASVEVNPRTCLERMLPIIQGTTSEFIVHLSLNTSNQRTFFAQFQKVFC